MEILSHSVPHANFAPAARGNELTSDEEKGVDVDSHVKDADLRAGVLARVLNAPKPNEIAVRDGDKFFFRFVVGAQDFRVEGDSLDVTLGAR